MLTIIEWLKGHRFLNIIFLLLYYVLVVLPHEQVGLWTVDVFGHLPRDTYNLIILAIAITCLALYTVPWLLNVRHCSTWKRQSFYLLATIVLAAYTMTNLFVVNIEVVHFVQYGIFTILCYPLIGNYSLVLIWTTLAGSLDEAYQYFYLSPDRTDYYDFNDVITNLIGGAFGLVFLRSFEITGKYIDFASFTKTKTFYMLIVLSLLFTIIINTAVLDVYKTETSEALYYLVKKTPQGWWSVVHPNVTFHIMQPLEGVMATIILWIFYRKLGE